MEKFLGIGVLVGLVLCVLHAVSTPGKKELPSKSGFLIKSEARLEELDTELSKFEDIHFHDRIKFLKKEKALLIFTMDHYKNHVSRLGI